MCPRCWTVICLAPHTRPPNLERRAVSAALRLLDASAITRWAIARQAGTTTATIYERFANRDVLLQSVRREIALDL